MPERHFRSAVTECERGYVPEPRANRQAQLRLRGRTGRLRAMVHWPGAPGADRAPGLLVNLYDDPGSAGAQGRELCARTGCVVVSMSGTAAVDEVLEVLGWAADHTAELDAEAGTLAVTGKGRLAVDVVARARRNGWPPVVLLDSATLAVVIK